MIFLYDRKIVNLSADTEHKNCRDKACRQQPEDAEPSVTQAKLRYGAFLSRIPFGEIDGIRIA